MIWLREVLVSAVMITLESVHGVLRTLFLAPRVGDLRARQVGFAIGSLIVVGTACIFAPWLAAGARRRLIEVGVLWAALTLAFEVGLGRVVLGLSWDRIVSEFDPSRGGWMALGLLLIAASPLLAARLRRLPPG